MPAGEAQKAVAEDMQQGWLDVPSAVPHDQRDDVSGQSLSGGGRRAAIPYEASFVLYYNSRYAWSDSLIDCLTIVSAAFCCVFKQLHSSHITDC